MELLAALIVLALGPSVSDTNLHSEGETLLTSKASARLHKPLKPPTNREKHGNSRAVSPSASR